MYSAVYRVFLGAKLFGVTVFHRSIVNWSARCILSIYTFCYMVSLIWCNGIP